MQRGAKLSCRNDLVSKRYSRPESQYAGKYHWKPLRILLHFQGFISDNLRKAMQILSFRNIVRQTADHDSPMEGFRSMQKGFLPIFYGEKSRRDGLDALVARQACRAVRQAPHRCQARGRRSKDGWVFIEQSMTLQSQARRSCQCIL